MRLPVYPVAFALVVLLASTTPVGTGLGLHQFDLVHPLFAHVHIVGGRVITHEQVPTSSDGAPRGVAMSVDTGASPEAGGLGLTVPTTPEVQPSDLPTLWPSALFWTDGITPSGREEAPPDPPPHT